MISFSMEKLVGHLGNVCFNGTLRLSKMIILTSLYVVLKWWIFLGEIYFHTFVSFAIFGGQVLRYWMTRHRVDVGEKNVTIDYTNYTSSPRSFAVFQSGNNITSDKGRRSKIVNNCVTSFTNNPSLRSEFSLIHRTYLSMLALKWLLYPRFLNQRSRIGRTYLYRK